MDRSWHLLMATLLARGSHAWKELLDEFRSGTVTIAVANFPMINRKAESFIPAIGPLRVWMEEQKIPTLGLTTD